MVKKVNEFQVQYNFVKILFKRIHDVVWLFYYEGIQSES